MPMVSIREMRVCMGQQRVPVLVSMFNAGCNRLIVRMLMMFIMGMFMLVLQRFMAMWVFVPFAQM